MSANNVLLFVFAATEALTAQIQPDIVRIAVDSACVPSGPCDPVA